MLQIGIGILLAVVAVFGTWYSIRRTAALAVDKDSALAREKLEQDRQLELTNQALEEEKKHRDAEKAPITDHAGFLRDSTRS